MTDSRRSPGTIDPTFEAARVELAELIERLTGGRDGTIETAIPGLVLHRISDPGGPKHHVQMPALCIIAQGSKRILVGDETYAYDPLHYLVSSIDLPVVGRVLVRDPGEPYLGMRLRLDMEAVGELIDDQRLPEQAFSEPARGLFVNRLDVTMLDPILRLVRLLEAPIDIPIVAPLVKREILYRLLMNGEAARLRQMAQQDSQTQRIARAVRILRERFSEPLSVETLARDAFMSVSSFHHHFKSVTAMTPLQYQKQLRLQEARRLIFATGADIATAAHRVGYESASQFSREYGRLFGQPPLRDKRRFASEEVAELEVQAG